MDLKLHIGELELALQLQDASQWNDSFQENLVQCIRDAFEHIHIPKEIENASVEYLEWDLGQISDLDELKTKIVKYMEFSWSEFKIPDIKVVEPANLLFLKNDTDSTNEINDPLSLVNTPKRPIFSLPAAHISEMTVPLSFFTQMWKQFLRSENADAIGSTSGVLTFLGLPASLVSRIELWAISEQSKLPSNWVQSIFDQLNDADYTRFRYTTWLSLIYNQTYKANPFAVLKLPNALKLKHDLLFWMSQNLPNSTEIPHPSPAAKFPDKSDSISPEGSNLPQSTDSNSHEKGTTSVFEFTQDAFWLNEINTWPILKNSASFIEVRQLQTLYKEWIKRLENWVQPTHLPFANWFLNHGLRWMNPDDFRVALNQIKRVSQSLPTLPKSHLNDTGLLSFLEIELPKELLAEWELQKRHEGLDISNNAFWILFKEYWKDLQDRLVALIPLNLKDHPLVPLLQSPSLEAFLALPLTGSQSASLEKVWKNIMDFKFFIQNSSPKTPQRSAFLLLIAYTNLKAHFDSWIQLQLYTLPSDNNTPRASAGIKATITETLEESEFQSQNLIPKKFASEKEVPSESHLDQETSEYQTSNSTIPNPEVLNTLTRSLSQIDALEIYRDLLGHPSTWEPETAEAWQEWQNTQQTTRLQEQNPNEILHQSVQDYLHIWFTQTPFAQLPTMLNSPKSEQSLTFFLEQWQNGLLHLSKLLAILVALPRLSTDRKSRSEMHALINASAAITELQKTIPNSAEWLVPSQERAHFLRILNLNISILLNDAFVWLYVRENPEALEKSIQKLVHYGIEIAAFLRNPHNSNFPKLEINLDLIPLSPLVWSIDLTSSNKTESDNPTYTLFQGVELDWIEIDTLLQHAQTQLRTHIPELQAMPESKWTVWMEDFHPVGLTEWYHIESLKRKWQELQRQNNPKELLSWTAQFIETLNNTVNNSFTPKKTTQLQVIQDWKGYLQYLTKINMFGNAIDFKNFDRERLQIGVENRIIRISEAKVALLDNFDLPQSESAETSNKVESLKLNPSESSESNIKSESNSVDEAILPISKVENDSKRTPSNTNELSKIEEGRFVNNIDSQKPVARRVEWTPSSIDYLLPFEAYHIPYIKAVQNRYYWLPTLLFPQNKAEKNQNNKTLEPPASAENQPIQSTEKSRLESENPNLHLLKHDLQKHLWFAALRKNKANDFYALAEVLSMEEVIQWTNSSHVRSLNENQIQGLQQFIRQEFGIAVAFKLNHHIKHRLLLIEKPQTRLDISLILFEEIYLQLGGMNLLQAQRMLNLMKSLFSLEKLEFARLQEFFNAQMAPALLNLQNKPEIQANWEQLERPPELGAWFQSYIYERPFLNKETLFYNLQSWAKDRFPEEKPFQNEPVIRKWLNQELEILSQSFRNTIKTPSVENTLLQSWLLENLIVWLTHQKALPLFEEIRQKSRLDWLEITRSLNQKSRRYLAEKTPEIHPVLKQFARSQQILIEKQALPSPQLPISGKPEISVPLIPKLQNWLNPFTKLSAWLILQELLDSLRKPEHHLNPHGFLLELEQLNLTFQDPSINQQLQEFLIFLVSWALPLESDADGMPFLGEIKANSFQNWLKNQERIQSSDLEALPNYLQHALFHPDLLQKWQEQFKDILNDLTQRKWGLGSQDSKPEIRENRLWLEAFKRFLWELNSPIYLSPNQKVPYWYYALRAEYQSSVQRDLPENSENTSKQTTPNILENVPIKERKSPLDPLTNGSELTENQQKSNDKTAPNIPDTPPLTISELPSDSQTNASDNSENPEKWNNINDASGIESNVMSEGKTTSNDIQTSEFPHTQITDFSLRQAEIERLEIERLRMTRHVFWEQNEDSLKAIWGNARTLLLRQWSEQLKNALPQETEAINRWLEAWLAPISSNTTDWILEHSIQSLMQWSFEAGWSNSSKFEGVKQLVLLLSEETLLPQLPYSEGLVPLFEIRSVSILTLAQNEHSDLSEKITQRILHVWQEKIQPQIDINTLLDSNGVHVFNTPINPGLTIETSREKAQENIVIKRDIEKGVRFNTAFCGMMMIAPYYSTLFKRLKLMEGQQFISESHQISAYQVLLYIAEIDAETPVFEMQDLIPRIITGIAPESELFIEKPLNEDLKTETKRFLSAIKMQWPLITNMSLRGFIESFLMRGGLAWKGADGSWNIEVEGMGSDIIMSTLPWGYATMKFPWTAYLVYTTWKVP